MPAATVECLTARLHPHRFGERHASQSHVPLAKGSASQRRTQGQSTRLQTQVRSEEGREQGTRCSRTERHGRIERGRHWDDRAGDGRSSGVGDREFTLAKSGSGLTVTDMTGQGP